MKWTGRGNAKPNAALLAPRGAPCRLKSLINVREDNASSVVERSARIRQFDAAGLAAKQLHIEFSLHCPDQPTEWGLLHAQTLGSPCDVSFFGDCEKIPEMPQFHSYALKGMDFVSPRS
jgi:hypothetical protein